MASKLNKNTLAYKNKLAYIKEYNKKGYKIYLQFNRNTDSDIIKWLEDKQKATVIKRLIREKMQKERVGK